MLKRTSIIAAFVGLAGMMISTSCNPPLTSAPAVMTSPALSPTELVLTNTPASPPTIMPTKASTAISCPWIPYLNRVSISSLSNDNCLDDVKVKNIGVSGDAKQISFYIDGASTGTYGICRDISEKDNLKFSIAVRDSIASARFLVMIGPSPVPIKTSSRGFRIQPEAQREMYVKFIEYVSELDGYDKDIDKIQAIPGWKLVNNWNFDFVFKFSGSKINVSMNQALFEQWQLNSPNRYLCFAYQATPTATQATELEVQVNFH
jgi:hypothetical protein